METSAAKMIAELVETGKGRAEVSEDDIVTAARLANVPLRELASVYATLHAHGTKIAGDPEYPILKYIKGVYSVDTFVSDLEAELASRANSDLEARATLIDAFLHVVLEIAYDYSDIGISFLELVAAGNQGLLSAIEKCDSRDRSFDSWLMYKIENAIIQQICDVDRPVQISSRIVETVNRLLRARRELIISLGREPTPEEIAQATDMPLRRVSSILRYAFHGGEDCPPMPGDLRHISRDEIPKHGNRAKLQDFLKDDGAV